MPAYNSAVLDGDTFAKVKSYVYDKNSIMNFSDYDEKCGGAALSSLMVSGDY